MTPYYTMNTQWIIQKPNNALYPYILIDNWYTQEEEKMIWAELNYYHSLPRELAVRAEDADTTAVIDGKSLGYFNRFYLKNILRDQTKYSNAARLVKEKVYTDEFESIIDPVLPYSRSWFTTNADNTMLSYYEEGDYYAPHHDTVLWTQLVWMFNEPREFTGGELTMEDTGERIELKSNRAIFFPSCLSHSVEAVKKLRNDTDNWGKWTITTFYSSNIR